MLKKRTLCPLFLYREKGYKSYSYLFSQASFVFLVKKNPLERKVFMSIQSKGFKYIDILCINIIEIMYGIYITER